MEITTKLKGFRPKKKNIVQNKNIVRTWSLFYWEEWGKLLTGENDQRSLGTEELWVERHSSSVQQVCSVWWAEPCEPAEEVWMLL